MDGVSTTDLLVSRSLATRSYGVFYMTSLISVVFWAMLSLQTFWYFASYERDKKSLKFLVVFLWMVSTVQTYVIVYGAWVYMIEKFGDYLFLFRIVSPYASQFVFGATATITVQSFFVSRVSRLSGGKLWMVVAWAPLATFQIVAAFIIVIKITTRVIQRLMLLAVLNMVWSTAFAICDLAITPDGQFVALDGSIFYILFDMPICSLYCNTLLANLNMRTSLAERQSAVEMEMDLTTFNAVRPQPLGLTLKKGPKFSTQTGSRQSSELAV
ncbi:hypothetical protein AZE42_01351 [Rhizopogon vesiculosus]|uniref:DUF6534 domain-containing protein n=1 Tax=Rhizopogon vesiculosus TaxID=180088 RepID=A0A1J8RHB8_9AGAM|nr:hypothetical protein AZE42_01351 [Rhizopogon vesiculosus]